MADDKYSLKNTAINDGWLAFGDISLGAAAAMSMTPVARDQASGLGLALDKVGLRIDLLTTAIEALTLKLSSQRLLSQALGVGDPREPASGQKVAGKPGSRIEPPDLLKPSIEMDSAMADLARSAQFTPRQREDMVQPTQQIATAPLVAAGGTKAVDLVRIQDLAAKAGIVSDLPNASDRQFELLRFASDAGVAASAFKIPAMDVAEMMVGWRTSMKLNGAQAFDLADAINHLSKMPGGAKAPDIGAVLQGDGGAATAVGLTPTHAAALTAALLKTGTQASDGGTALNTITTAMGKGDQASATERAAWKQLKLDPVEVAGLLRQEDKAPGAIMSVLAALNAQPAETRSALATMLFASGDKAALGMSSNLAEVSQAFWQVLDKRQYATSELGDKGSVKQDALAQSNTRQGQRNIVNARTDRLSMATDNALAPLTDSMLASSSSLVDGLSELAETFPKTTAAIVVAAVALKPLVGGLFKAVMDEMSSQVAKRVLGRAAPHLPGRLGEVISEDFRNPRANKLDTSNANQRPESTRRPKIRVSARGSRGTAGRYSLGPTASLRSMTRKAPGPLKVVGAVADVAEGVLTGDKRMMGAGLGAAGGGWAGAAAGAAGGAALGSVVPVIGTAIGGLVGGLLGSWLGSDAGASLGEKLVAPTDRLAAPDQVSKDLTSTQTATQQNTMTANIYINGQDQASASQLANLVAQQLSAQFALTTMPNSLAMRSDAALTDGGT
ncbi:phage tail tape measure protein [Pseudomonas sp. NFACC45]|uniref:phage tail tape measure protein n=1 Tax=Pseudomonas sp. NFACC45 TaxID=1566201 RepID=UPI0008F06E69|nr:phage tail tape measure protein [Pseudomonas sp. NFACC45]SFG79488.1 phage tail tape measure protein, TP901 family, core region [Pseudomonas sp. NFACC45]